MAVDNRINYLANLINLPKSEKIEASFILGIFKKIRISIFNLKSIQYNPFQCFNIPYI